jgi:putative PIN family toxin of toxin-antitoxin system
MTEDDSQPIIVLDTNVLVSALLSPFGPPGRLLDLVLIGEIQLALDDRLLAEYREVLSRPRFRFAPSDVAALLAFLEREAVHVVAPSLHIKLPDTDDLMFLEVAHASGAVLVTGNSRHFPEECRGTVAILSPRDFIEGRFGQQD